MPVSAPMRIKAVSVDYREKPEYKFPAASEGVAKVYAELLKPYKPRTVGIVERSNSSAVLAKVSPTLLIAATRDFALSGPIRTDILLTRAGVDFELHVLDGLFHGFFYNADVPESKETFAIVSKFFDRHLGRD